MEAPDPPNQGLICRRRRAFQARFFRGWKPPLRCERPQAFDSAGFDPYHARAMDDPMLESVPPAELATRAQVIETQWKIEDFKRLTEIIEADLRALPEEKMPEDWRRTPVDIRLHFGRMDSRPGVPALHGGVSTTVAAVCQRCLEPLTIALEVDLKLLLPPAESTVEACEGYEVWEFEADNVSPRDIVEEALVMAMPFAALHEPSEDCARTRGNSQTESVDSVRPFSDLRSLMAETDDNG